MNQRAAIIKLVTALADQQGVTHYAISMRIFGKGDFFQNMIEKGWDCRTRTAERVMRWFSDNWPSDLEWPSDIPRPPASDAGKEVA